MRLSLVNETHTKPYTGPRLFNKKSFSALHLNVYQLILIPYINSIISLSETKIKYGNDPIINLDFLGYNFISQASLSDAGGVGFYVNNVLVYSKRDDLSHSENEHESLYGLRFRIKVNTISYVECFIDTQMLILMLLQMIYSVLLKRSIEKINTVS